MILVEETGRGGLFMIEEDESFGVAETLETTEETIDRSTRRHVSPLQLKLTGTWGRGVLSHSFQVKRPGPEF